MHEIEETLKQVRLKDADENDGLDVERKTTESGESPCDLPPTTSVHQCISAANPPVIIHCSGEFFFYQKNIKFLKKMAEKKFKLFF